MKSITLVTGGIKSGKSSFALRLAENFDNRFFIATAEPFDNEMKKRIERHKKERGGKFRLVEEPIYLSETLINIKDKAGVCVIDCLNIWLNNLIYYDKLNEIDKLLLTLDTINMNLIFVTNEIGMGIIPENELSRRFLDMLGELNQKIAGLSGVVYLMISGVPWKIKGEL